MVTLKKPLRDRVLGRVTAENVLKPGTADILVRATAGGGVTCWKELYDAVKIRSLLYLGVHRLLVYVRTATVN